MAFLGDDVSLGVPKSNEISAEVFGGVDSDDGSDEVWMSDVVSSKRLEWKLGSPQLSQYQLASVLFRVFIFIHSVWYHSSQFVQAIEWMVFDHLQAFLQIWHGYLGGRGPG